MNEIKTEPTGLTAVDASQAPVIYFEKAPVCGHENGIIKVTLTTEIAVITNGQPVTGHIVVGYLRTTADGAKSLIEAINGAFLIAQPIETATGKSN